MDKEKVKELISKASVLELELVWLPKIMKNQTDEEKEKMSTLLDNGLGLNNGDAPVVSYYYRIVSGGGHLSFGQGNRLKKILPKYWGQFV